LAAINRANHACIRLNPYGVPTMKQSYASAGKAPRRRVHSLSGIAAIAECGLPPPRIVIGLYGAFIVKGASRHFGRPLHSILLFDPRREHSSVPTAYFHRRRAQRRSRTALLQRRRRLVLDGREHGGRLPAIGWLAAR